MTFRDLTFHLTCILLYLMLDCLIFLIIYLNQDTMGEDNVFLTYFTSCLISDFFFGIFLPSRLLLRSRTQYPRFWSRTKFDEKIKNRFNIYNQPLEPRRYIKGAKPIQGQVEEDNIPFKNITHTTMVPDVPLFGLSLPRVEC